MNTQQRSNTTTFTILSESVKEVGGSRLSKNEEKTAEGIPPTVLFPGFGVLHNCTININNIMVQALPMYIPNKLKLHSKN